MKTNHFVEDGATLAYIKAHGRCAITGQPFSSTSPICGVLLPKQARWPLPVWGDYPLGTEAKQVAFIIKPTVPVQLGSITEATQCDGSSITFHLLTFKPEEAIETATVQEIQ